MPSRKLLLVGWDAADWKVIRPLLDGGKMPHVQRLVNNGSSGQIATLYPPLSPMLWTSIATGKRPFKHGIHGFSEPSADGSGVRPVTNLSRKAKTVWNILNQNDRRSVVIGWWPSHPAEPINGVMVSDLYHRATGPLHEGWNLPAHTVYPPKLAKVLADLRVHPDVLEPRMVEPFIPLAQEIDQERDPRLAAFLRTLAECMSIQAAALWLLEHESWDFFAVYYEALDHFCHSFMRYHPPRQSWIAERDFELYHRVVSMAYQLHDEMLGALLGKAGDDATVILMSDHGFHPDHLRPASIPDIPAGPAIEHRDLGVFAMSGPGIRRGEVLQGISVLDIAPTILMHYGLPVGEDMDGKPILQALLEMPEVSFVPSWEEIRGTDGRHPLHTRIDPVASYDALEQMIALGYIERPDEDREVAIKQTLRDLRFNLGEAYQDAGRHREAHEVFRDLYESDPGEQRFAIRLFVSCQALGMRREMRRIVDDLNGRPQGRFQPAVIDYLQAQVLTTEKRYTEALSTLERLISAQPARPELFLQKGDLYLRVGRERDANQVYEKALALDPDNTRAYLGLCRIALRRQKYRVASQAALDAVQRNYHDPMAHFLLGRALAGMKRYERAADALRAAISFNPNFPEAHTRLARLLEHHLGEIDAARDHRCLARRMRMRMVSNALSSPISESAGAVTADAATLTGNAKIPPTVHCLVVVTGLPRSGTSMLMQMIAAGGLAIVADESRQADEDNPRGYLEFAPVKNLRSDSEWLFGARGKAIKIVVPLLAALPPGLPCRVILCERDLDEVLDSQDRMLRRRQAQHLTLERRRMLKHEYQRQVMSAKTWLAQRPATQLLVIEHGTAISNPLSTAEKINEFLEGELDLARMAAAVEPGLHRNRGTALTEGQQPGPCRQPGVPAYNTRRAPRS
jgi:tetratricopeptide (TPR) repeat protein